MWLTNSSIGRKVLMSVTGIALILFLTFHACMNVVALIDGDAYNTVCSALGANWYAVVATVALAVLVVIHFVYAIILTPLRRDGQARQGGMGFAKHVRARRHRRARSALAPLELLVQHDVCRDGQRWLRLRG